ncbi:MAG TPA: DUF6044 family protein, partial [Stellaceae bacterium]|nr:DUF6044 family protein [Stellaceae bacterium]
MVSAETRIAVSHGDFSKHLAKEAGIGCVLLALWYLPWLFNSTAVVRIQDNLDSEVVSNYIIGAVVRGDPGAPTLALNGHLPIWALSRLCQPLTLLYAVPDPWLAYALEDIIVRVVAFVGTLLLARRFGVNGIGAILGAFCFTASIIYSVHALTVAGLPLVLYLLDADRAPGWRGCAVRLIGLFVIGWNSSLALSGGFFLAIALPVLRFGFNTKFDRFLWIGLAAYAGGLAAGNWNIIYAQYFSGIVWQRAEFHVLTDMTGSNLRFAAAGVRGIFFRNRWHHADMPKILFLFSVISTVISPRENKRTAVFICFVLFCVVVWVAWRSPAISTIREQGLQILREFQSDRFFFVSSTFVICAWFAAYRSSGNAVRVVLTVAAIAQACWSTAFADQWHQVLRGRSPGANFSD